MPQLISTYNEHTGYVKNTINWFSDLSFTIAPSGADNSPKLFSYLPVNQDEIDNYFWFNHKKAVRSNVLNKITALQYGKICRLNHKNGKIINGYLVNSYYESKENPLGWFINDGKYPFAFTEYKYGST